MKKFIIINGTMGVGKTTVCKHIQKLLSPSVFLDGDWCWNMNPWVFTEESKSMVMDNITYLLKSFLKNSGFEYIIFCWVIHEEKIMQEILDSFTGFDFELYKISLICTEDALRSRLQHDIEMGWRSEDIIDRSLQRIHLYDNMATIKVDVSNISALDAAASIADLIEK
jgi:broad-specificity NMP kinase